MKILTIEDFVQECVEEYKRFVGVDSFPKFSIIKKQITIKKSLKQGFDSWASTFYDTSTGNHTLEIYSNLCLPKMNAKYLVFHELTHIWDAEVFSQCDKLKHMSNKGYTEYHAAQIDFLKVLGAESTTKPFAFEMSQLLQLIEGQKTAEEFVDAPRKLAVELINRSDFPASIETLTTTLGAIYNYYGRRSICQMYCKNYYDNTDLSSFEKLLGKEMVLGLNAFMQGWFDKKTTAFLDEINGKMYPALALKYKLT